MNAGIGRTGWGWGVSFFEYENDGDPDVAVTNGSELTQGADPNTTPFVSAANDPTSLYLNDAEGVYSNETFGSGIYDTELGKAILVLDYDNDGDEDLIVTNSFSSPIVYRNDASTNGQNWIRLKLQGIASNRDGIGALVRVTENGETQTAVYNPSNAYIGQREGYLHFGIGNSGDTADRIEITWPSGTVQELVHLESNQLHLIVEPESLPIPPAFGSQPVGGTFERSDTLLLTVDATGTPAPVFVWEKDGVSIEGATGMDFRIKRLHPYDAGVYRAKAINQSGTVYSDEVTVEVGTGLSGISVARAWNEFLLDAIRKDYPAPTIHSRNLYHTSAAMWDAFWAYDVAGWSQASEVFHKETPSTADWVGDREGAQAEAISYAAYRVLTERYKNSPGKERSLFGFRWLMEEFGCDPEFTGISGMSAAAVGNRIGYNILAIALGDGANEGNRYVDSSDYSESNEPLILKLSGPTLEEPNHWQPLAFEYLVTQSGIPIGRSAQIFLGAKELAARNEERSLDDKASISEVCALRVGAFPLLSSSRDAAPFIQLPAQIYSADVRSGNGEAGVSLIESIMLSKFSLQSSPRFPGDRIA